MAEDLRVSMLNNGDTLMLSDTEWHITVPSYCWYNNDPSFTQRNFYGALYNNYAVNSGSLCPAGWHIPTEAEWTILEN